MQSQPAPQRSSQRVQTRLTQGVIELGVGHPSLHMLPFSPLQQASAHLFAQGDPQFLQYGDEWGDGLFRETWAAFLSERYSQLLGRPQTLGPEQLWVSGGVSHTLDLICTVYTQAGDTLFVEDPTYFLSLNIFRQHGLELQSIPVDAHGLQVEVLAERLKGLPIPTRPRLVYTIPTHQNPSGSVQSAARREQLLALAEQYNLLIVADEVYHLLTFGDSLRGIPSFSAYDGPVLSLGSFSKILAPGLRLGWVNAHPSRLQPLAESGVLASGGGLGPLSSALVQSCLELGLLGPYLDELRQLLGQRADTLMQALQQGGFEFERVGGGYFVWVTLPSHIDAEQLLPHAVSQGVRYQWGQRFSPAALAPAAAQVNQQANKVRLCFAFYDAPELSEGVERLSRAIAQYA